MTAARLLDLTALATGAWLAGALLLWSGWSASLWTRPEHVSLVLLGIVALRLLVAPVPVLALEPRRGVSNMLIDPRPELRGAKITPGVHLYNKTDTHWNQLGAFHAYRKIVQALARARRVSRPELASLAHYDVVVEPYEGGDLAVRMLFSPGRFSDRDVILRPRAGVPAVSSTLLGGQGQMLTNPEGTGHLLLEGDSFAPPLAEFLARHFASVLVPETGRFDGEVVARLRPDVVLLEVAERNLNRLAREPRQLARVCDR